MENEKEDAIIDKITAHAVKNTVCANFISWEKSCSLIKGARKIILNIEENVSLISNSMRENIWKIRKIRK